MQKFYTSVVQHGKNLLVRSIENGRHMQEKVPFRPTLFVNSTKESKYKNLKGRNVEPIKLGDINEAKDFVKQYEDVTDFPIYGNTSFAYQYISETYPRGVDFDLASIRICSLDIEVESENGFPDPRKADEKVLLITLRDKITKETITFGTKPFDVATIKHFNPEKYTYVYCTDERDLFRTFLRHWVSNYPDVITGWNSQNFDLPYLINRGNKILNENEILDISPWRNVRERIVFINKREIQNYDIVGIASLDYLDLYKKFGSYSVQESYKLDYIAKQELGRQKLENPYDTYKEFYAKDWALFVEYNVIDTLLVDELEMKMGLIDMAITMAYDSRCNYVDVYHAVRLWDCILCDFLMEKNIVVPQRAKDIVVKPIEGGYVKLPKPARYNWVMNVDATSEYPSVIMQWNMSPETYRGMLPDVTVTKMLNGDIPELEYDVCLAANGTMYTKEYKGIFPQIVEKIFGERVYYKKKYIEAQKLYEKTHDPQLLKDMSKYNNIQMAKKIQLNSLYGAMANEYFRFYDNKIAEAITMTGQYVIRSVGNGVDEYMNKMVGTTKYEYVFYSDTDSCYITFEPLVKKYFSDKTTLEIVDLLDKVFNEKVQPAIGKITDKIFKDTNSFQKKMFFKREVIANTGIWTNAKKKYVLNVYDSEGVRYDPPKIKITGMESNRSSTPEVVRKKLKEALRICLNGDQATLQKFIKEFQKEFKSMNVEQISFPRGVNDMEKYARSREIYAKGTPIHVRAALMFNHLVKERGLQDRYEEIQSGDKIKFVYLQEPNPIGENIIGFIGSLPKEFELERYVDYSKMFENTFERPITSTLSVIGWDARPKATLDFLLGD